MSMSIQRSEPLADAQAAVDPFGRQTSSLRISVTQRCDLRCPHCHREGQKASTKEMTPAEIARIVSSAASLGVRKVKITGGEPLMREDIVEIVSKIAPMVREVSMTTNGVRLSEFASSLKKAGLARVNVSLHTLDSTVYGRLCGTDTHDAVKRGIREAIDSGLDPVKVNMVVFRGENDSEIESMAEFCGGVGAILQLIEYESDRRGMRGSEFSAKFFPLTAVEKDLAERATDTSVNELHRRRRYVVPVNGHSVTVEVVRPMHNTEFCANCTRIRLSSDGLLKPCLLDPAGEVDVLGPIRNGASDRELKGLFLEAVSNRRPYWS